MSKNTEELVFVVTDIEWDTDGENDDLPTTINVPIRELLYDGEDLDDVSIEELKERVGDYISDETGFCHFGFTIENE